MNVTETKCPTDLKTFNVALMKISQFEISIDDSVFNGNFREYNGYFELNLLDIQM